MNVHSRIRPNQTLPVLALLCLVTAGPLAASQPPERGFIGSKQLRHPDLTIAQGFHAVDQLPAQAAAQARRDLSGLGVPEGSARIDVRGGGWATLLPERPMIPGKGLFFMISCQASS